jgi:RNA polymerase sigma-70 factor (ECF subfamily)
VLSARAGSRDAFEELVRRHQKVVFFFCRRYVQDLDVAADLTQRAFLRAFKKIGAVRDAKAFRSWLLTIAVNLARNHVRDAAKFTGETAPELAVEPEAQESLECAEGVVALRRAVARLPEKQRMVVSLRVYEDLPFRDVAQALGITENAAKVNYHYAVRSLRTAMAPRHRPGA